MGNISGNDAWSGSIVDEEGFRKRQFDRRSAASPGQML